MESWIDRMSSGRFPSDGAVGEHPGLAALSHREFDCLLDQNDLGTPSNVSQDKNWCQPSMSRPSTISPCITTASRVWLPSRQRIQLPLESLSAQVPLEDSQQKATLETNAATRQHVSNIMCSRRVVCSKVILGHIAEADATVVSEIQILKTLDQAYFAKMERWRCGKS